MSYLHTGLRSALMASAAVAVLAAPAYAQATKTFNIPAQDAVTAVPQFAQQSGLQVLASADDLRGVRTNALQGNLRVDTALTKLVAGTGLNVRTQDGNSAVIVRASMQSAPDSAAPAAVDAPADAGDAVVVVGMRKSLRDALDTKRRETGVVEVIASKDIGVLPDVTIAESLARLPGVNTTRDRGNDSQAAIRGIGPRMVLGTVNGREVASSEPDRNVRWEIYPSEVVSGVSVYKSSEAKLLAGGISGTVDIQTIRPLDYRGPEIVARAGVVYYDGGTAFPGYDGLGYRGSGSLVKKLSPEFAFVLGVTAQQQKNGYESFQGWGYNDDKIRPANNTGPIVANGPDVPTPWGAASEAKFLTSDRYSLSTGFQWKPSEFFELTYDLLYSKFKISEHQNQQWFDGNWGNWDGGNAGGYINPVIVGGDLVGATTSYSEITNVIAEYSEDKDLIVTGLNGKWTEGAWTATADISYSKAERSNLWQAVEMRYYPATTTWRLDGDDPFIHVSTQPQDASQSIEWVMGAYSPGRLRDELGSASLDFRRHMDDGFWTSVQFGLRLADRTKSDSSGNDGQAGHLPGVTTLPSNLFTHYTFKNFDVPSLLDGDFDKLVTAAYGAGALDFDPKSVNFNSEVQEKVAEAYIEGYYDTTFAGTPVNGNIGLRAVSVSSESAGESRSGGGWFQDIQGNWAFYPLVAVTAKGGRDYTKLLPSAAARFDLGDGAYLKLGAARVLSRPPLNELKANRSISPTAPFTGSAGNPYLKPFEATQFDASYEWYFNRDALFAVAGYYKQVDNYVGYNQRSETINGNTYTLISPVNKDDSGYIAGVELTYQTPFSFIPGFEKFGIYSNLALVDSDIEEFVPSNNPLPMNGVAKTTATVDLWYSNGTLDARLGARYHSAYTAIYGWDSSALARVAPETTLDASASYALNSRISFRVQAANLLDTPLRAYYDNKEDRLLRNDYYGRRFLFDVTVKY
ncbi:TonB-denpendent receptor [Asticcacaulis sp. AC460]|uniref:TonB-dependent receptor n=1 Tax=Asticcacaulis sp. AC460 TaxID=1282360 RepID=UPI0003C40A06|nr:TonB-dependent receptor [Asticcacaulis sp. AC460]ESQ91204.1 TonB-denpendent receptor [Asticcacaulis sp. AC460]